MSRVGDVDASSESSKNGPGNGMGDRGMGTMIIVGWLAVGGVMQMLVWGKGQINKTASKNVQCDAQDGR